MVVLQRSQRAGDRINQARRTSRAAGIDGSGVAGRSVGVVEKKVAFFDCPAVVAAEDNAVNLLNRVLAHVRLNQIAGDAVERKTVRIAQPVSINFRHLARALERVGRRNAVLAVGADRVGAGGIQRWVDWIEPQHFSKGRAQVLCVSAWFDVARAGVIGVAAVAKAQIQISVGSERNRAAVVIAGVLAEGNHLAPGSDIHEVAVRVGNLPFVDHVLGIVGRRVRRDVSRRGRHRDQFAVVGVERLITGAGRVGEAGMKGQAEQAALVVGVGRVQRRLHAVRYVERRAGQQDAVLNDTNQSVLLQDEQSRFVARWTDGVERRGHAGGDGLHKNVDVAVGQPR